MMTKDKQIRDFASEIKECFSTEKKWRKFMKKWYRTEYSKSLKYAEHILNRYARPLTAAKRVAHDEWDGWTEYGFLSNYYGEPLNGNEYTDEEIREWLDENMRIRIYSPYDCTGLPFTMYIIRSS